MQPAGDLNDSIQFPQGRLTVYKQESNKDQKRKTPKRPLNKSRKKRVHE